MIFFQDRRHSPRAPKAGSHEYHLALLLVSSFPCTSLRVLTRGSLTPPSCIRGCAQSKYDVTSRRDTHPTPSDLCPNMLKHTEREILNFCFPPPRKNYYCWPPYMDTPATTVSVVESHQCLSVFFFLILTYVLLPCKI